MNSSNLANNYNSTGHATYLVTTRVKLMVYKLVIPPLGYGDNNAITWGDGLSCSVEPLLRIQGFHYKHKALLLGCPKDKPGQVSASSCLPYVRKILSFWWSLLPLCSLPSNTPNRIPVLETQVTLWSVPLGLSIFISFDDWPPGFTIQLFTVCWPPPPSCTLLGSWPFVHPPSLQEVQESMGSHPHSLRAGLQKMPP